MNGFVDDPLISTLLNQPIVAWSLGISAAIFVIAIGLAAVFKLRNRYKLRQSEKLAAENLAKEAQAAAQELIGTSEKLAELSTLEMNGQPAAADDSIVSGKVGERTMETAVSGTESETPANIAEVAPTDALSEESKESDGSKSALASIFEDEIIVDPYLQAMRDNLPDITMSKLNEETQSIISQLLKREAHSA